MTKDPIKIPLHGSTYITKVNGKLVMVRERRETFRDVCRDLLGEAFGKYPRPKVTDDSESSEAEIIPDRNTMATPSQETPAPPPSNPSAELVRPEPVQSIMGPMGLQPGIYRFGNRQVALLPLNSPGDPAVSPETGYAFPQPSWTFPQATNMGAFNFPPMIADPQQLITSSAPTIEPASQTSVTVTKHVCAECGRLRSRKYQHEHPLKPGETPPAALCKKCQKDLTSTDESDTSIGNTGKQTKLPKKAREKKSKSRRDTNSSDESVGSVQSRKLSKPRVVVQKVRRNKLPDEQIAREEAQAKRATETKYAHPHEEEDYVSSRNQASPQLAKVHVRYFKPDSSRQGLEMGSPLRLSSRYSQSQRSSAESVATDAADVFHYSSRSQSQSTNGTYDTSRLSKQTHTSEDPVFSETTSQREYTFENPLIRPSKNRSGEAPRRQRYQHSDDPQNFHREHSRLPKGDHPLEEDEVVVVTEHYVVRPRPLSHVHEEIYVDPMPKPTDRAADQVDKSHPRSVAEDEHTSYSRSDWPRAGERDRAYIENSHSKDYKNLTMPADPYPSENGSSYRNGAAAIDEQFVPQAPSPLRFTYHGGFRTRIDQRRHEVPYDLSREDDDLSSRGNYRYATTQDEQMATRGRSSNTYRPPHVREATDRGTEKALTLSPKYSRETFFYPDTRDSEMTEGFERVERHVTFRDQDGREDDYDSLQGETGYAGVRRGARRR